MITYVLSGINRGLGKELYKLLASEVFSNDQKIFITRSIESYDENANTIYINKDLSEGAITLDGLTISQHSKMIIFINNAGVILPIGKALEADYSDLSRSLNVNCLSPIQISQNLALKAKKLDIKLFILNITSGAANRPIQGWLAYCLSKAAVKIGLDVISEENDDIEVMHFDPGVMDTDMQSQIRNQDIFSMPNVEIFKQFKSEGLLKDPRIVAKEIFELIGSKI